MCDPHGASNLLTSRSDDNWKSVRKAIAVSFSFQNIKVGVTDGHSVLL